MPLRTLEPARAQVRLSLAVCVVVVVFVVDAIAAAAANANADAAPIARCSPVESTPLRSGSERLSLSSTTAAAAAASVHCTRVGCCCY